MPYIDDSEFQAFQQWKAGGSQPAQQQAAQGAGAGPSMQQGGGFGGGLRGAFQAMKQSQWGQPNAAMGAPTPGVQSDPNANQQMQQQQAAAFQDATSLSAAPAWNAGASSLQAAASTVPAMPSPPPQAQQPAQQEQVAQELQQRDQAQPAQAQAQDPAAAPAPPSGGGGFFNRAIQSAGRAMAPRGPGVADPNAAARAQAGRRQSMLGAIGAGMFGRR